MAMNKDWMVGYVEGENDAQTMHPDSIQQKIVDLTGDPQRSEDYVDGYCQGVQDYIKGVQQND